MKNAQRAIAEGKLERAAHHITQLEAKIPEMFQRRIDEKSSEDGAIAAISRITDLSNTILLTLYLFRQRGLKALTGSQITDFLLSTGNDLRGGDSIETTLSDFTESNLVRVDNGSFTITEQGFEHAKKLIYHTNWVPY
ncbi:MAG TPA: hypothetical protein VFH43_13715 [Candidatus Kapabacteria bacterium]|nr:hypothetical protein [Candidatus Kapabacteria bacterium]